MHFPQDQESPRTEEATSISQVEIVRRETLLSFLGCIVFSDGRFAVHGIPDKKRMTPSSSRKEHTSCCFEYSFLHVDQSVDILLVHFLCLT